MRTEQLPSFEDVYHEVPPPPVLARYLTCTWVQRIGGSKAVYQERILPDGCADIVGIDDQDLTIVGPATEAEIAHLPPRSIVIGARFRPGMAPVLLGLPASELLNTKILLRDAWGRETDRLAGQIDEARSVEAKLRALEDALIARLPTARPADSLVEAAVAWLSQRPTTPVHELGQSLGISDRQLLRRFQASVGYGPKALGRILRLQQLLASARKQRPAQVSLAALAAETGYADQAHMTREFTSLAGVPPTVFLSRADSAPNTSDSFKTAPITAR